MNLDELFGSYRSKRLEELLEPAIGEIGNTDDSLPFLPQGEYSELFDVFQREGIM